MHIDKYDGREGNRTHCTLVIKGNIKTNLIQDYEGRCGEIRGKHRNYKGSEWNKFMRIQVLNLLNDKFYPVFICVEPDYDPKIYEGNHKLDMFIELKIRYTPVEIRFFGKSERYYRYLTNNLSYIDNSEFISTIKEQFLSPNKGGC